MTSTWSPLVIVLLPTFPGVGHFPVPKESPVLKCELSVTGKSGNVEHPTIGVIVITNVSSETIDIGSTRGPLEGLVLKVKNPKNEDEKPHPYTARFGPFKEHVPTLLKPGESHRETIGLLTVLENRNPPPGTYKVKAVYTFRKKNYESAEVQVTIAADQ
jgi:hypothetical protein